MSRCRGWAGKGDAKVLYFKNEKQEKEKDYLACQLRLLLPLVECIYTSLFAFTFWERLVETKLWDPLDIPAFRYRQRKEERGHIKRHKSATLNAD